MKKFDRAILIFIGLGIWTLAMSQILQPSIAHSGQTHNSVDITDLEEFFLYVVNPVQKEFEDLQNDVSVLNERVRLFNGMTMVDKCVPVSRSPRERCGHNDAFSSEWMMSCELPP